MFGFYVHGTGSRSSKQKQKQALVSHRTQTIATRPQRQLKIEAIGILND